jgi:hypothetical protein
LTGKMFENCESFECSVDDLAPDVQVTDGE